MSFRSYIIAISIVIALVLQIMPMPIQAAAYRPDWLILVLAYWTMALPAKVNIGIAFICGIVLDVLLGTTLGVHSIALSICIFVVAANYQRLRNYSVWQQSMIMSAVFALYHLLLFWVQHLITDIYFQFTYLWPVVTSCVIWPYIFMLLRKVRRQFRVT